MANEEHLAILKKGVKEWNAWRLQNPGVRPDLGDAGLRGADLKGADLESGDFVGADLRGADLGAAICEKANFARAQLDSADLAGASLSWANLNLANFERARMVGVDMSAARLHLTVLAGADLRGALFGSADLYETFVHEADFAGSHMNETVLGGLDLSTARGLEAVRHKGPSSVGIDTIYRSKGKIPEVFLRGAGVPEPFIASMKALVAAMEPIQFYSCFISYSSKDKESAERLYADLQQKDVRCWFAPEDMKIGDRIRPRIDEAIRVYDKLLLVLTESSVKSAWVEKEVETAFEKERKQGRTVLFPIRLDDAVMEADEAWAGDIRRTRHIGDFSGWKEHDKYKRAFERLMRDLKAEE